MFELIPFGRNPMINYFNQIEKSLLNDTASYEKLLRADIIERDNSYIIEAEIPGFNREDISINAEDELLTIKAQRNVEVEEKDDDDNYIRRERRTGTFVRKFSIPDVNIDEIEAKYENGILSVVLPKPEDATPKKRTVEIN